MPREFRCELHAALPGLLESANARDLPLCKGILESTVTSLSPDLYNRPACRQVFVLKSKKCPSPDSDCACLGFVNNKCLEWDSKLREAERLYRLKRYTECIGKLEPFLPAEGKEPPEGWHPHELCMKAHRMRAKAAGQRRMVAYACVVGAIVLGLFGYWARHRQIEKNAGKARSAFAVNNFELAHVLTGKVVDVGFGLLFWGHPGLESEMNQLRSASQEQLMIRGRMQGCERLLELGDFAGAENMLFRNELQPGQFDSVLRKLGLSRAALEGQDFDGLQASPDPDRSLYRGTGYKSEPVFYFHAGEIARFYCQAEGRDPDFHATPPLEGGMTTHVVPLKKVKPTGTLKFTGLPGLRILDEEGRTLELKDNSLVVEAGRITIFATREGMVERHMLQINIPENSVNLVQIPPFTQRDRVLVIDGAAADGGGPPSMLKAKGEYRLDDGQWRGCDFPYIGSVTPPVKVFHGRIPGFHPASVELDALAAPTNRFQLVFNALPVSVLVHANVPWSRVSSQANPSNSAAIGMPLKLPPARSHVVRLSADGFATLEQVVHPRMDGAATMVGPLKMVPNFPLEVSVRSQSAGGIHYAKVEITPTQFSTALERSIWIFVDGSARSTVSSRRSAARAIRNLPLRKNDKIQVATYGNSVRPYSKDPFLRASSDVMEKLATFVEITEASGAPDLAGALATMKEATKEVDPGAVFDAVFLCDGLLSLSSADPVAKFKAVQDIVAQRICVNAVITHSQPEYVLLDLCCWKTGGKVRWAQHSDHVPDLLVSLVDDLSPALVHGVEANFRYGGGHSDARHLPILRQGKTASAYLRFVGSMPDAIEAVVQGTSYGAKYSQSINATFFPVDVGSEYRNQYMESMASDAHVFYLTDSDSRYARVGKGLLDSAMKEHVDKLFINKYRKKCPPFSED